MEPRIPCAQHKWGLTENAEKRKRNLEGITRDGWKDTGARQEQAISACCQGRNFMISNARDEGVPK